MSQKRRAFDQMSKSANARGKRSAARRLVLENLEDRKLMAVDLGDPRLSYPQIGKYTADLPSFISQAEYNRRADLGGNTGGSRAPGGSGESGGFDGTEREPNNTAAVANLLPLSTVAGGFQVVTVRGQLQADTLTRLPDTDVFAVDLRKGDFFSVEVTAQFAAGLDLSMADRTGVEMIGVDTNLNAILPQGNPFKASPAVSRSFATVIPETGRYFVRLGGANGGTYTSTMRATRSTFELEPVGTRQILYLDFNGELLDTSIFGVPGTVRLPSLLDTLEPFGFTEADVNQTIDAIVNRVKFNFQRTVALTGGNGYYGTTGNPGEFDVEIRNSRDNADPWGLPNVSRVIIGGGILDLGIPTRGIAQSVDIGNFVRQETAVVLPEVFFDEAADATPRSASKSVIDMIGVGVGNTTSHEAGHFFGALHQNNANATLSLMDSGGVDYAISRLGVGPDGIFGTTDDIDIAFRKDRYEAGGTGIVGGSIDHAINMAFALSSGKASGTITGVVYNDFNRNSRQDAGELGLAGWQVYADTNNNAILDNSEPRATTDSLGRYTLLTGAGQQKLRVVRPTGWLASNTAEETKTVNVVLNTTTTANFGSFAPSGLSTGFKWLDINGDGVRDAGEPGLSGVYIYLDLDGDARPDVGEPATLTKADGSYLLTPPLAGTYSIREVVEPGYVQTFPASGFHSVVYNGSTPLGGLDFGNRESSDWGDAPAPYATLRSNNGASAGQFDGFRLGTNWDAEIDGRPTSTANGDDTNGPLNASGNVINDEDGVTLLTPLVRGDNQNIIRINVTNTTGAGAFVQGWIDFNGNGVWGDPGEQIVSNLSAVAGNNLVTFTVPANAVNNGFARFRLSQTRDVGPTGRTAAGEVEDYVFTVNNGPRTILQNDSFTVARNSTANIFDVLANDFLPPNDPVSAVLPGPSAQGGTISIGPNNTLRYTPPRGFFGQDSFTYTVVFASGKRETANVTVIVNLQFTDPVAVDDSFDLPTNSVSYPLNVLLNDIEGAGGSLVVTNFTNPDKGGAVSIGSGGLSLRYTPRRGFGGTESFTYTVTDGQGKSTTARVTVHTLEGDRLDDNVEFSFGFRDMAGNPVTSVTQGDQFQVYVYTYDLRPERGAGQTPPTSVQNPGVYAAYLDMLYSSNIVLPSSPGANTTLDFANAPVAPYRSGISGSASVPGVIRSLGAFTGAEKPPFSFADPSLMTILTFTARSAGLAEFVGDPANESPNTDVVLFNPPNAPVPLEQVRYLRSTIEVVPRGTELPFAVDDSTAELLLNSTSFINVLANDIVGTAGPIRITSVSQPANGVVSIDNRGTTNPSDDRIQFVPFTSSLGFSDQFTYSIADTRGFTSTATVTLKVGDTSLNDKMKIQLKAFDLNGRAITSIPSGSQFELRGYVQDLRSPTSQSGVFAAYQDILYDRNLVAVQTSPSGLGFQIEFAAGPNGYSNGKSGDIRIPGLINEVGSFQDSSSPLGTSELLQFSIRMKANTPGVARFVADPADISPFHDSLLYSDPRNKVPYDQISYLPAELVITGGSGSAGGEGNTNPFNRFDVNNDGFVSPIDALILVNQVNTKGGGALGSGGSGEGEFTGDKYYVDVNEDGYLSPLDILWVVNRINGSNGSGEGEAAPAITTFATSDAATMVDVPAPVQANWNARSSVPTWASKLGVDPNSVDSLLAGYAAQEDKEESNVGLLDDLFANDLI